MLKIEVRKESNHVIIENDKYKPQVNCFDASYIPDIGVDYIYLQWSDAIWYEKFYVDLNNHIQPFTAEQLAYIEGICANWVQPLGQEGNLTVEQAKITKTIQITDAFNQAVTAISTALPHEMVSWRKQEEQARAWNIDNTVATPIIDAILLTRDLGETKQQFVDIIITNANAYEAAYGTILGKFQNLSRVISNATTVSELETIAW